MSSSDVLTSWKEIAEYLGKGVRTVQRWELELGLPVRRPVGDNRHVVIATRSELDEWMNGSFARRETRVMTAQKRTFPYRVLVVDDDAVFREVLTAVLESQGYEVLGAEDGFDALATLKKSLPDVIISDLRMPNMNGFEFLSVVRHRFPRLPAIAVSGEFRGIGVPESVLADAYFEKGNYSPSELLTKVSDLLVQVPTRPRDGKRCQAPVWIPNPNSGQYVVVTCSDCLRTFPVFKTQELRLGTHHARCDYCGTDICFHINDEVGETTAAAD